MKYHVQFALKLLITPLLIASSESFAFADTLTLNLEKQTDYALRISLVQLDSSDVNKNHQKTLMSFYLNPDELSQAIQENLDFTMKVPRADAEAGDSDFLEIQFTAEEDVSPIRFTEAKSNASQPSFAGATSKLAQRAAACQFSGNDIRYQACLNQEKARTQQKENTKAAKTSKTSKGVPSKLSKLQQRAAACQFSGNDIQYRICLRTKN